MQKILKDRKCVVCGKKFDVKLLKGDKIPKKYFYSSGLGKRLTGKDIEYWECEKCATK